MSTATSTPGEPATALELGLLTGELPPHQVLVGLNADVQGLWELEFHRVMCIWAILTELGVRLNVGRRPPQLLHFWARVFERTHDGLIDLPVVDLSVGIIFIFLQSSKSVFSLFSEFILGLNESSLLLSKLLLVSLKIPVSVKYLIKKSPDLVVHSFELSIVEVFCVDSLFVGMVLGYLKVDLFQEVQCPLEMVTEFIVQLLCFTVTQELLQLFLHVIHNLGLEFRITVLTRSGLLGFHDLDELLLVDGTITIYVSLIDHGFNVISGEPGVDTVHDESELVGINGATVVIIQQPKGFSEFDV